VEEDIVVGSTGTRDLKVDVFTPPDAIANGIGVLLVHGGAWTTGDRGQLRGYGIYLGRQGYTSVACEYRLTGEAIWPAQIDDVETAYAWTRANAGELGIDPERIAVSGNSAGGHLSLMLAARQPVAACIAIYPPTDLGVRASDAERAQATNTPNLLLGSSDPEVRAKASPITYVRAAFPPVMLIHGNADTVVSVKHSFLMYRALVEAGAKAELHIFEGAPHAFERTDQGLGRQTAALMKLWLDRYALARIPAAAK
jgi:acetyl esterase/lipase